MHALFGHTLDRSTSTSTVLDTAGPVSSSSAATGTGQGESWHMFLISELLHEPSRTRTSITSSSGLEHFIRFLDAKYKMSCHRAHGENGKSEDHGYLRSGINVSSPAP